MFNGETPFWLAPVLTLVVLGILAYREQKNKKKGIVQFDERSRLSSYKASHFTLMICFAVIAILISYANITDIQEIDMDLLSFLILPLTFVWLIIFSIIKRK
jgi:cytochrome bd-type quinol oxidase subunit 1